MIKRTGFATQSFVKIRKGFTLVELLVVIGIIALLISILLPALNRARKSAITLKCASALREIGHAYELYASDNKGWWPPAKLSPLDDAHSYSIGNVIYLSGISGATTTQQVGNTTVTSINFPCYWYNFVSKYVTRYNIGTADAAVSTQQQSLAEKSLLWGCPEWAGYTHDRNDQLGYGVNYYPTMTTSYPVSTSLDTSFPDVHTPSGAIIPGHEREDTIIANWSAGPYGQANTSSPGDYAGSFYQEKDYTKPSERALVADSIFWITTSYYIKAGDTPFAAPIISTNNNSQTPAAAEGETWADFYRHGTYPKILTTGGTRTSAGTTGYDPGGGKVGYNILFCDGHVITSHSKTDAFLTFRMRYPG